MKVIVRRHALAKRVTSGRLMDYIPVQLWKKIMVAIVQVVQAVAVRILV
jgi:hypothetical protein